MSKQAPHKKYHVTLTTEERTQLQDLVASGKTAARTLTHARILLKADESAAGPAWQDQEICAALDVGTATVARVRQRFVEESLAAALHRRPPQRDYPHLVDGVCEAHLVALSCSAPPAGHKRWTLRLLADKLVELAYIETISHETVRQALKKRTQALAERAMVHCARSERRVRLPHGGCARPLHDAGRPGVPAGVL